MFTGLVQDLGLLRAIRVEGSGARLEIQTSLDTSDFQLGESIAVNGACLTVERLHDHLFEVVAGAETLARSTTSAWRPRQRLHLERALRLGDRMGGHWVQGHVDAVGVLERVIKASESVILWVAIPPEARRYIIEKGSICIDGVSLTVNEMSTSSIRVNIIPHTWSSTRFAELSTGERVNIEVDILARYVEGLLSGRASSQVSAGLDLRKLQENGFV